MRLVSILIIFTLVYQLNAQTKPIDVYLIGGQSNATGQGYMVNIPEDFSINTAVLFFYSDGLGGGGVSMQWGPLCQASESPDKFGVELSMGSALKKQYPDHAIALIKHALYTAGAGAIPFGGYVVCLRLCNSGSIRAF
jgi:hypothetical protein